MKTWVLAVVLNRITHLTSLEGRLLYTGQYLVAKVSKQI
jgi:hypothetical protein